jgi:hypothetical protein
MGGILSLDPLRGILSEPEPQPNGGILALTANPMLMRQMAAQRAANQRPNVTDIFGYGPSWRTYLQNFNKNLAENYPTDSPEAINKTVMRMALNVGPLATVWHGSPHLFPTTPENPFGKFDLSRIGTGEGAQAYGHGAYLAENKNVAKSYSELNPIGTTKINRTPNGYELLAVDQHQLRELGLYPTREAAEQAAEAARKNSVNLYTVDLPDEAIGKMLDWDKPLSQQPETVRNLVNSVQRIPNDEWASVVKAAENGADNKWGLSVSALSAIRRGDVKTGADLVNVVGNGPAASAALRAHGITGIKYLDQGSRSGGKGTSNYVVFDDQIPKIIGRE